MYMLTVSHFIEAQALDPFAPDMISQEEVELLRCIAEARKIFTQRDNDVWTLLLRILDQLQLVQASPTGLIIAGYYDLFLLHGEGQMTKLRVFSLEHGGVEAVVILPKVSQRLSISGAGGLVGSQNV